MEYSDEDFVTDDEVTEAHLSDVVFEDLEDDARPFKAEWEADAGYLITPCGCHVAVYPGDTVWYLPGAVPGSIVPIAVDPVTIH